MFIGDFNFYIALSDRNKRGNMNDIFIFNEAINYPGRLEPPPPSKEENTSGVTCKMTPYWSR